MSQPGRYAKGIAKRDEILRAALETIAANGFKGSTLREIAAAVGLTNAGVLHYFGSKEELFAEVLRLRDATSADEGISTDDPLGRFVAVVRHNAEVPGLVQLYSSLSAQAVDPGHGANEFFARRYPDVRRILADALRDAMADGTVRPDVDSDRFATILVALADGLQTQWLLDPEIDMADHIEYLLELAVRSTHE